MDERGYKNQTELAFAINVSQQHVSKWLTGFMDPSAAGLKKLAKHFDVTTDFLVGASDERKGKAPELSDPNLPDALHNTITIDKMPKLHEDITRRRKRKD